MAVSALRTTNQLLVHLLTGRDLRLRPLLVRRLRAPWNAPALLRRLDLLARHLFKFIELLLERPLVLLDSIQPALNLALIGLGLGDPEVELVDLRNKGDEQMSLAFLGTGSPAGRC